jgi:hypothetical protein
MQVANVTSRIYHIAYTKSPTHVVSLGKFLLVEDERVAHFQVFQLAGTRTRDLFLIIENEEGSV